MKYNGLDFPLTIDIAEKGEKLKLHINAVGENMQENSNAFEAWAILLYLREKKDIILSFEPMNLKDGFCFQDLSMKEQHYMRFLYRLSVYGKDMRDWFCVSEENQDVVASFQNAFNNVKKVNNYPDQCSDFNRKKGDEHVLEKAFTKNILDIKNKTIPPIECHLHDQLPVGIFAKEKAKKTRIFSGGSSAIDLWGVNVNDNSFCIYELKKIEGNDSVGIISELYFYANIMCDLLNHRNGFELNQTDSKFRGYNQIIDLIKKNKDIKIKAYFLVKKLHSRVEELKNEIIELLNKNTKGIEFAIIKYDVDDSLDINALVKKLNSSNV